MSRLTDEDGIDGPFNRAMNRAIREDAKPRRTRKARKPVVAPAPVTTIHSLGLRTADMEGWEVTTRGTVDEQMAVLLAALSTYTLDPAFEEYGNFVGDDLPGHFFGNFYDVSGVFSLDTTDAELIAKLTAAIRANQATAAYAAAKVDREQARADRAAREAAQVAEQDREHARRYAANVGKAR